MSFSTDVKKEVAFNLLKPCCRKAELSALIQLCSTLSISQQGMTIMVKTENVTVAKRIWTLLKEEFDTTCDLSVIRKMNLRKNNIYQIRILQNSRDILHGLGILTGKGLQEHPAYRLVQKECCARAYLAGAFMAMGSVNNPAKSSYHLEIITNEHSHAEFIQKIMERFGLSAKIITRRNHDVVYLKAADQIADFLRCIGAHESLMEFENVRIERDFRNNFTRLDNCELANEVKTQAAAKNQLEDILTIQKAHLFEHLEPRLKEVAQARLDAPEASLKELCAMIESQNGVPISKSGIKHRFKKLQEMASRISETTEKVVRESKEGD